MFRKIMLGGATVAVIAGAGTAALATTGSDTTTGTPAASSTTNSSAHHAKGTHQKGKNKLLRHLVRGQIVVKTKKGYVTHDLIRGTVSSVSATSITVEATDKTSETFVITKDTKIRKRSNGKPSASTIDQVNQGDHVLIGGTGTSTFTAKHVIDVGTK